MDLAGDAARDLLLLSVKFPVGDQLPEADPLKAATAALTAKFQARYKRPPNQYVAQTYDATMLAREALNRGGRGPCGRACRARGRAGTIRGPGASSASRPSVTAGSRNPTWCCSTGARAASTSPITDRGPGHASLPRHELHAGHRGRQHVAGGTGGPVPAGRQRDPAHPGAVPRGDEEPMGPEDRRAMGLAGHLQIHGGAASRRAAVLEPPGLERVWRHQREPGVAGSLRRGEAPQRHADLLSRSAARRRAGMPRSAT